MFAIPSSANYAVGGSSRNVAGGRSAPFGARVVRNFGLHANKWADWNFVGVVKFVIEFLVEGDKKGTDVVRESGREGWEGSEVMKVTWSG